MTVQQASSGRAQRDLLNVAREVLYHLGSCVNSQIQTFHWASEICVWGVAGREMDQDTQEHGRQPKAWFDEEEEKERVSGRGLYENHLYATGQTLSYLISATCVHVSPLGFVLLLLLFCCFSTRANFQMMALITETYSANDSLVTVLKSLTWKSVIKF